MAFPHTKRLREPSPRADFAVAADRTAQSPARTASANSNEGSMVLHIEQIQFIAARGAECVPTHTHTHTEPRNAEARIQVSGWQRNAGRLRTSPTVRTIEEPIYNISNRDEERRPFSFD